MLKHRDPLSLAFQALADPTRRDLVDRLVRGPAAMSDLAAPLDMTLSAVHQHLSVLTEAGLVRSEKVGRVRTFQVAPEGLRFAEDWLAEKRTPWERRLDRLGGLLADDSPASDPTNPCTEPPTDKE